MPDGQRGDGAVHVNACSISEKDKTALSVERAMSSSGRTQFDMLLMQKTINKLGPLAKKTNRHHCHDAGPESTWCGRANSMHIEMKKCVQQCEKAYGHNRANRGRIVC